MSRTILIIKLGAMGDVLRTTPLLLAYKRQDPHCRISWITDPVSGEVLEKNPFIADLVTNGPAAFEWLQSRRFDLAINLDKEPPALDLMSAAQAAVKQGFGWDSDRQSLRALNPASEYAVRLGVDDSLKFRLNPKTYQEICHEQAGFLFEGDEYVFRTDERERLEAGRWLASIGLSEGQEGVGINTGSGERFAGKKLPIPTLEKLARLLHDETGRTPVFLGGPSERERNEELAERCRGFAVNAGTHHPIRRFAALVERLPAVITGDTIAMHIAIAVRVPVVVFFGSTCASEIELYGRGKKIVSSLACAPCYKGFCPADEACMNPGEFSAERMAQEILSLAPLRAGV